MHFVEHDNRDDLKIWLSEGEIEQLLGFVDGFNQEVAFGLGVRCGLRSQEIVNLTPADVKEGDAGWVVRVWDGKGGKDRQVPCPPALAMQIEAAATFRPEGEDDPVVLGHGDDKETSTRTLRRWISTAGEELAEKTGDELWANLSMHDLRRTWASSLDSADVDAAIVCEWGGWSDLDTFLDHYRAVHSPEAHKRERQKVDWL